MFMNASNVDFGVGDIVLFGRPGGEQTVGRVTKLNPKRVKIVQLEARGSHQVGITWNVSYSIIRKASEQLAAKFRTTQPVANPTVVNGPWPINQRIVGIRPMRKDEADREGWSHWDSMRGLSVVIVLGDGTKLYASSDPEGNDSGCIFAVDPTGQTITLSTTHAVGVE